MITNVSNEIYSVLDEAKKIAAANPQKSFKMSEGAYYLALENNLKLESGYALIGMSLACRSMSELNKWLDYSYNAYEIFKDCQDCYGQIRSLNLIGIAYFYNSMYEQALANLLQALELLENYDDKFLKSCVINNIGEVYRESGRDDKALEFFDKALGITTDLNLKLNMAAILNNIGKIYFKQGKYDSALNNYTKSYDIFIDSDDIISLGEVENLIGEVYLVKRDYSKSEEYCYNALERLEHIENKFNTIDVLTSIGKLKLEQSSEEGLYYFEKAIQYAEEVDSKKKLSILYKMLADYYEKSGSYEYALENFKKFHSIEQEIAVSLLSNKLEILQIEIRYLRVDEKFKEFETINKNLEIEINKHRSELENIKRVNKSLEKKALEDELTNIPNRRYISGRLAKVLEECCSENKTIALFMIDIDNFKKYNDFWGHAKGDECLVRIAKCLDNIRSGRGDVFGRYGGEEFVYFATGLNYEEAVELGDLMKNEVEKLGIRYTPDKDSNIVTISLGGVLGQASHFDSTSEILQISDRELYNSKRMGRNMVNINHVI